MFQCPNCGGNLKFDIPSQQLGCEYCNSLFDPYSFEKKDSDAVEQQVVEDDYEVTIFTCPQCGGEILSTDNAAAGFCSFCGASTILYSRISREHRPNYIIPFKKTKEDCKQSYASFMKKAIFAPKELKDPSKIDSFRGIYMPYWAFYITQQGPVVMRGEKSHRSGNYIITDHYNLEGDIDAYYKGLSYDASSSFDDALSQSIAPYDVKGMKAFTPSYLSGFYADTADVAALAYQPEAEQFANDESLKDLKKQPAFAGYTFSTDNVHLRTQTESQDMAMFPVWFMSYRNGDRVAYATVNGQTGKVVSDLPVDIKKYLLGSLVLAIPLFIIFNLLLTLNPTKILTICAVIAVIATFISMLEINSIVKHERKENDKGYLAIHNPDKLAEMNKQITSGKEVSTGTKDNKKSAMTAIVGTIIIFYVIVCFGFTFLSLAQSLLSTNFIWILMMIAIVLMASIGLSKVNQVPGKKGIVGLISVMCGVIIGAVIRIIQPVSDIYYYAATILLLVAVFFTLRDVMLQYNILSTRRLPQFDKQGGDDRA